VNIETSELIELLRQEEHQRHEQVREEEEARHNQELKLISALEQTIRGIEERIASSKSLAPAGPDPAPPAPKRRGRKPGRKPKPVPASEKPERPKPVAENRGYVPMREKIAKAAGINVAAEARIWIADNKAPFTMEQISTAINDKTDLNIATVKARLFPFLAYLEERGQVIVTGEKRNHVYTPTESFDPNPKRGVAAIVPTSSVPPNEKEKLWKELRSKMPAAAPVADE
jgi:hypothetical protein